MSPEAEQELAEYHKDVQWLREHVARDDIYDFAHQLYVYGLYFAMEFMADKDPDEVEENDPQVTCYLRNILSIAQMKRDGFTGIINTEVTIIETK